MPTPSDLVTDAFATARTYALGAEAKLATFITAMNGAVQLAPLVDIVFPVVASPTAATAPAYTAPADYSSSLLVSLAASLTTRLAGGTGLSTSVETALWNRARDRETFTAQAAIDAIARESEALGFDLPVGVANDSIRRESRNMYDKISTISRDIAIEQAKLEQSNMQKSIDQVISFEGALAELINKRASLTLDAFKAAIAGYQAEVEGEMKYWEAQIKQNEAQITYIMNGQKLNSEIVRANLATVLEAGKIGSQVYSQLTAAAYGLIRASAAVSGTSGTQVAYNYGNTTTSGPAPLTSI